MVRKQRNASGQASSATSAGSATQAGLLRRALEWFSKDCSFTDLRLHGNVGWQACQLVVLGVLWSWSDRATLARRLTARQLANEMFGLVAVTILSRVDGRCGSTQSPCRGCGRACMG